MVSIEMLRKILGSKGPYNKIRKNKNYLGMTTIKDSCYYSLWLFFKRGVRDATLKRYFMEANSVSRSEGLDPREIIEVYNLKVLVIS